LAYQSSFYVTGGTLQRDAACYVRRRADDELFDGLSQGQFCYVLTSRQMGKSSLMVRTATRLRQTGAAVAVLDLTAIGQNLTAEQWYDGLIARIGQQLDIEDEIDDFWLSHERLGPLQRWMLAIEKIVMSRFSGRVVIFIDEIDAVLSLPFPTDEFFAGIREFYNRRAEDSTLERLVFCLLGVATPSNLIQDTRTTPFNIGRRIELNDFTEPEAAILATGLGRDEETGRKMIGRVLYWTGGHPYLTQRVCQSVSEDESAVDTKGVDRVCESLFFSSRARERDDNLLFVRQRLLRSEIDLAALLDIYSKVRRRKRVRDDETNALITVLRLSGITKAVEGHLQVRNRIYHKVFDRDWILANVPDAELQRQRVAYLKGLLRAAAISTVIVILMLLLLFTTFEQKRVAEAEKARAQEALAQAEEATRVANDRAAEAERQRELTVEAQTIAASRLSQAEQERLRANLMTWEMIKEDSNPQTFRAFLEVSPTKELASKARARLRAIGASQSAQTAGVIRGKLYDAATNEPVQGGTVTIKNSENESSAVSSVDGEFLLALIPSGVYSLSITHPQYEKKFLSSFEVKVERINRISRAMGALRKEEKTRQD